MPVDTQQLIDEAGKLGRLVAQHPAIARYREAQRSVSQDPDAGRLLSELNRFFESLARQEASGMPVSDAQRQQLESLQSRISSHLKIKNLNIAQVEFVDLLRKISQTIQQPLADEPARSGRSGGAGGQGVTEPGDGAPAGPRLVQ
jgi:cell fate (sporulation/competence/biofilm development) regulator YlbF (YheA/YmcA/DUF963 family)